MYADFTEKWEDENWDGNTNPPRNYSGADHDFQNTLLSPVPPQVYSPADILSELRLKHADTFDTGLASSSGQASTSADDLFYIDPMLESDGTLEAMQNGFQHCSPAIYDLGPSLHQPSARTEAGENEGDVRAEPSSGFFLENSTCTVLPTPSTNGYNTYYKNRISA